MLDIRITNKETEERLERLKEVYKEKTNSKTIDKIVELDYNRIFTNK